MKNDVINNKPSNGNRFKQFATFRIAGRHYGVDITMVREVNAETVFTTIPHAQRTIRGYVNIRGQIHLVLDLGCMLGFGVSKISEKSRIILFKPHVGESFAILVDVIDDVIEIDESLIENNGGDADHSDEKDTLRQNKLIAGVCKLENDIMMILNAVHFLPSLEI